MEMLPKIDTFQFEVDKTTVDKLHRMRPSALCNTMLACAGHHADTRGFGATRKLGWVMARMVLDIKNIPLGAQKFTVETFIKNAYRGFTDRCLRALDENGNEIAAMMCTFAMIDLDTRSPFDFDSEFHDLFVRYLAPEEPFSIPRVPSPRRCNVDDVESVHRRIRYSDVDINGHMNSIRYIDHIMDILPLDYLYTHDFNRFVVAYMQEAKPGEGLNYFMKEVEDNGRRIEICRAIRQGHRQCDPRNFQVSGQTRHDQLCGRQSVAGGAAG